LAFVDAVGVAEGRVAGCEAVPGGGTAQIGLCQGPERVTLADLNGCNSVGLRAQADYRGYGRVGKLELGAGADLIGVGDARIDGEEFMPAIAAAEILLCQLPEGIAGPDADCVLRGDRGGGSDALRLYRLNRCGRHRLNRRYNFIWCQRTNRRDCGGRGGRLHRLDENAWRREARKNFWLRGRNYPAMSAKCWPDIFTKVRANIFANARTNF